MKITKHLTAAIGASIALLCGCSQIDNTGVDLQSVIDNAAKSKEKEVTLSGRYFVDKPIRLTSAHSEMKIKGKSNATISGGKLVKGWVRDGKMLKAKVDTDEIEALFVNGNRAEVAQTDDMVYMYSYADENWKYEGKEIKNPKANSFKMRNEDLKFFEGLSKSEIQNSYLDIFTVWYNNKVNVLDIVPNADGKTSTVLVSNTMDNPFYQWETAPRFKICNAKKALNKAGEFFFDKTTKTLFYLPLAGENEKNIEAYYPVVGTILFAVGDSPVNTINNVEIENITFEFGARKPYAGWRQSGQGAVSTRGFITVGFARNVDFEDCEIRHTNGYAISFNAGCQDCDLTDSHLWDLGAGGVKITDESIGQDVPLHASFKVDKNFQTNHIEIKNNIINAYGRFDKAGVGVISMRCGNVTIDHNTIFDGYYSGVSTGWTWGFAPTVTQNLKITNNRIFKLGHGVLCDMGGIYTLGDSSGSIISGNEISEVRRHRYGGWGIYNDEGSHGFLITKNYVHHTQEDGYFMHYGEGCTVKNNIFTDSATSQVGISVRMFIGFKEGINVDKTAKKTPLKDGFNFYNNIVVYTSPARLLRESRPIPTNLAKFDKNIYWNTNGEVTFAGLNFEKWKSEMGQDKNSFIADPKLKGTIPTNDIYKKIDFEPFDTLNSGVKDDMKNKLQKILKDYNFPPTVQFPVAPPWKENK